ncbi:hypothetical protein F2Q70_00017755 [Brassica cretica]|uniref:Uncharacterized protein n=1 Tax=Brassica cretica TaxID=69181 RepID=A0A8S9HX00_BRACR|nr:hypothetical protein F2Q70_00017755 [Brassica cretica]
MEGEKWPKTWGATEGRKSVDHVKKHIKRVRMDGDGMDGELKLLTLVLSKIVSSPNIFFMLIKAELR